MRISTPDDAGSEALQAAGFTVLRNLLSADQVRSLIRNTEAISDCRAGRRRLMDIDWCMKLAALLINNPRLQPLLPSDAFAAQCTLFTKTPANNWLVAMHQDLTIPVDKRVDNSDCNGWSEKEGSVFVQPPVSVLEALVAVRVHLDDCDSANGGLRVVPGTHRLGRLSPETVSAERELREEVCVSLLRGDALVMKPLLLHASSKAMSTRARRVLHFVFGPPSLPCGLAWAAR